MSTGGTTYLYTLNKLTQNYFLKTLLHTETQITFEMKFNKTQHELRTIVYQFDQCQFGR